MFVFRITPNGLERFIGDIKKRDFLLKICGKIHFKQRLERFIII